MAKGAFFDRIFDLFFCILPSSLQFVTENSQLKKRWSKFILWSISYRSLWPIFSVTKIFDRSFDGGNRSQKAIATELRLTDFDWNGISTERLTDFSVKNGPGVLLELVFVTEFFRLNSVRNEYFRPISVRNSITMANYEYTSIKNIWFTN